MEPDVLLQYLIDQEIKDGGCFASASDKAAFDAFLDDLNGQLGTDFHYLAEIDRCRIPGSGAIVAKHIHNIMSETARSYMMWQMAGDRIPGCGELLYEMYLHFKASGEYIAEKGAPSPAHIYVRYDNAFRTLRPRRLKAKLLQLAYCPRDAYYLPFSMRMLASWRLPECRDLLIGWLRREPATHEAVGLPQDDSGYAPTLQTIRRDLKFTALAGLKYYPSEEVLQLIREHTADADRDVTEAAAKAIRAIEKKLD